MATILNQLDPVLVEECAAYCPPSERNGMKKKHSRRLAVIILAACLAVTLAVTACATGTVQSLISKYWSGLHDVTPDDALREERPDYAEWLDTQLETQAMMLSIGEKAVQTEVNYPIPGLDGAGVTLLEYYYDGEKIALACRFRQLDEQVDFSFDAKEYANLPFQTVEADGYPSYRSLVKDPAALQAIEEKLQKDGELSFLVKDAWISDHVYADGADLGPCHGDPDENGIFTVDPIVMGMGEVELPESCRNLPEISVSMTYRVMAYAFKLEGDTVQYAQVGQADYPVSFTIPNLDPASIPARWSLEEIGELAAGDPLRFSTQIGGKTVTFDAFLPGSQEMQAVWMQADPGLFEKMGRELVLERFPQIEADLNSGKTDISVSDEATGNLLLGFDSSVDGRTGYLYFVDVQRDLNGSSLDGDGNWFTPHYLTATVPDGMNMTAEEAVREVQELLSNDSCFRFTPWNVQAEYDRQKQQGYYRITLRPEYGGIPVYGWGTTTEAFYSNDGLFACQGLMLLRESQRMAVQDPLSPEQAIESVVNNISALAFYDTVRCSEIRLGYLAQAQGEEVVLSPAWVFECSQTREGSTNYFQIAVLAENGKIWVPGNGGQSWVNPA
ncbi:MAG: hypothetical protein ACI3XG_06695 [Faecousia sp.]